MLNCHLYFITFRLYFKRIVLSFSDKVFNNKHFYAQTACVVGPSKSIMQEPWCEVQHFAMDTQVKSICQSTHLQIRNIREIQHLSPSASAAQLLPSRSLHFWTSTMPYSICSDISCTLLCKCTSVILIMLHSTTKHTIITKSAMKNRIDLLVFHVCLIKPGCSQL